jgi:hypothetical protein
MNRMDQGKQEVRDEYRHLGICRDSVFATTSKYRVGTLNPLEMNEVWKMAPISNDVHFVGSEYFIG